MPPKINPWIGVLCIVIGVGSVAVFAHYKIAGGEVPGMIVTVGIALLMAYGHTRVDRDYRELKASIRPPSLVDEHEKNPPS